MSIATELTALQTDINNARTAITTKGGTVTSGGGSSQLATDIATIPAGSTKSKTWTHIQSATSTLGATITIATGDSFIADNYNNSTLVMTITPTTALTYANQSFYGGVQKNTTWIGTTTLYYGRTVRSALSSTTLSDNYFPHAVSDSTTTPKMGFIAYSNGNLEFVVRDTGAALYLPAGTFIITATIE